MHHEAVEPFATPVGSEHSHIQSHKDIIEAGWDTGMEQACTRCCPSLVVRPSRMWKEDLGVLSITILTHGVRTFEIAKSIITLHTEVILNQIECRQNLRHSKFSAFPADIFDLFKKFSAAYTLEAMCYLLVHIVALN